MKYVLSIYQDEQQEQDIPEDQREAYFAQWFEFDAEMRKGIDVLAGEALRSITTATTVRQRDGDTITLDGPFAETKEQLGGFYLIDVEDLDQAINWAGKMPHLPIGGSVEVRPVMVFDSE